MRGLTHAQALRLRATPGATAVLFLTDRCPVGCAHCSVSSRQAGPTIRDWPLFARIVDELAAVPELRAVAVTGGEPFAERRGLVHAAERLHAAGKAVIVFTSGFWARRTVPRWVTAVLRRTGTVYLSVDTFHAAGLAGSPGGADAVQERAARAALDAGCHLVVQVLDAPGAADRAASRHPDAEVSVVGALPVGRGADFFAPGRVRAPEEFGPCLLPHSPTVRYDGVVAACCNEAVITGAGPAALRRKVAADGLADALAGFRADPVLRLMAVGGPVAVSAVAPGRFSSVCGACWLAHRRAAAHPEARAALERLAAVTEVVMPS